MMQSHYEINVSKNGLHLFATAPRSILSEVVAVKMVSLFREKFPESEGYSISMTYWKTEGHQCN